MDNAPAPAPEPSPAPSPAPAPAPAPSFRDSWPEEYRTDPVFKNFNTPEDILKSYRSAAKMVGLDKGEVARKPKADAPQAEWDAYYDFNGRPKTADDYKFEKAGDVQFEPDFQKRIREFAYKSGLNDKQFDSFVEFAAGYSKELLEGDVKAIDGLLSGEKAALQKEWGAAYEQKLALMEKARKAYGLDKVFEKGITNHKLAVALAALGDAVDEDSSFGGAGGGSFNKVALTPDEAKLQWKELQADQKFMKSLMDRNAPDHEISMRKRAELFGWMYPAQKKSA